MTLLLNATIITRFLVVYLLLLRCLTNCCGFGEWIIKICNGLYFTLQKARQSQYRQCHFGFQ